MKNSRRYLFMGVLFLAVGCSSTKLIDSWRSQSFDSLSNSKIMVVSKASDPEVRKSYEIAIATKLRALDLDVLESHLRFPALQEANTPEESTRVVKMFKDAGFKGIILTSLKQTIETQNGSIGAQLEIPKGYKNKSNFGFNTSTSNSSVASTSKTYVLEALTYNLTSEEDRQLVNVCLVDVTDPDAPDSIRKTFAKIIAKQFK